MNIDHERFEDFLYSLPDGLPAYLEALEREALSEHVPIIRKSSQKLLRFLLTMKNPKKILEVGTAVGFSALLMAEYSGEDTRLLTIEKMAERLTKARENFRKYDAGKKIDLIEGDASEVLSELVKTHQESFDFIFMDAAKGQYPHFLPNVERLLAKGGVLVTDNLLQEGRLLDSKFTVIRRERTIHKRMREYIKMLYESEVFETMLLQAGDGMCISLKK